MGKRKNIIAFIVIGILGAVCHFVYNWTGNNIIVGLFFPVNESAWEHLKLLFFPTLVYSLFEYFLSKEKPENYLIAVTASVMGGMLSILIFFYTISGISGENSSIVNVLTFYLGLFVMLLIKQVIIKNGYLASKWWKIASYALILIMSFFFMRFSFLPPDAGIFIPPQMTK